MPSLTTLSSTASVPSRREGSEPPPEPDQPPGPESVSFIRPARIDDLHRLIEIEQSCFDKGDALSLRSMRHALTRAHATVLVEDQNGQIAGYALVFKRAGSKVAWLNSLAVAAAFRGLGIGKRLLDAAESSARQHGYRDMRLEVRPDNHSALALYLRQGYLPVATIPNFYADGASALRHRKILTDTPSSAARRAIS